MRKYHPANILMKVSVSGSTSYKESEKKVYESWCKENNSQQAEESKPDIFAVSYTHLTLPTNREV